MDSKGERRSVMGAILAGRDDRPGKEGVFAGPLGKIDLIYLIGNLRSAEVHGIFATRTTRRHLEVAVVVLLWR